VLLLSDNETTEQLSAATGAARTTDLGDGGLVLGKPAAQRRPGWSNTNEGKVIAAAFLDAHNQLVEQVRCSPPSRCPSRCGPARRRSDRHASGRLASAAQIASCVVFFTSSITAYVRVSRTPGSAQITEPTSSR
jgi:hypothetical protein